MLVSNVIEVKTPPPPMYEEEMEEQRRLEAKPKYNKDLYAASDSELSSIESLDEDDDNPRNRKKRFRSKGHKKLNKDFKKSQKQDNCYEVRSKNYSGMYRSSASNGEELKLPEIASKNLHSHYSKQPTSLSKEPVKVYSIRSLASELLVPKQEKRVAATESSAKQFSVIPRRAQIRTGAFSRAYKAQC
eukprot:TRINITY_DN3112_c0_g1_i7.p3 TRINITY_DN3112_c0_g1~~TRINITY_DN3112_c0_g1_i7.p3  ORF type:complete len:188 (+),score=47.00 TRINITY_DN3112_c0_g1_i7:552-1115(+)